VRHQARKGNNAAKRQNRNTRRKPRHKSTGMRNL
jgi:hypothetical protein